MVSAVKVFNEERIQRNDKIKLQRIILDVLNVPIGVNTQDKILVDIFESRVKRIEVKDRSVYVAYNEKGNTITGYAFPVGGPGFWGPISGLVAVDPNALSILGIAFYKHSETPGLGARMTEDWFRNQFKGLRLFPIEGDKKIFYLKPEGTAKAENELDAITGATGTSRAVQAFLNNELDYFLGQIWGDVRKSI